MNKNDLSVESIRKTAFFTGHRFLDEKDMRVIPESIYRCISDAYAEGYRRFFCGCALGFDTIAAFQTIRLREEHHDVRLLLAIPCQNQAERWSPNDQKTYIRILEMADEKFILSPIYYRGAMMTRNRYMADRSSLCICFLKKMRGGTASTVRYALQQNRISIINLAIPGEHQEEMLRESSWNSIFTFPSVKRNAITVPLHLMQDRKLTFRNI